VQTRLKSGAIGPAGSADVRAVLFALPHPTRFAPKINRRPKVCQPDARQVVLTFHFSPIAFHLSPGSGAALLVDRNDRSVVAIAPNDKRAYT